MEGVLLGFLIPGPRELVLVAMVALALYGRSGARLLQTTRYGRSIAPWVNLVRPPSARRKATSKVATARPRRGRLFWTLALTFAAAAAAWIATCFAILRA